jgi:hypothetical protein
MIDFEIDRKRLTDEINRLSSWEDWERIEEDIFKLDEWDEEDYNIERDMERQIIVVEGHEWKPTTLSYDISPEIYHLHWKTRLEVFAKLEPDAAEENSRHPERYGKICVYCKRWSKYYTKDNCPECGNELLPLPLNE